MNSLEYLDNQLKQGNVLIKKISSVRSELIKAYQLLDIATNIDMYYSVDNIGADDNGIEKQRRNILSIYENLGTTISNTHTTITSIKKKISEK